MPISEKDKNFMEKVAEYFCSTKSLQEPNGSIRDTAAKFNINRNKVRKILITMGELESPIAKEAIELRKRGMTIKEIAQTLGVSAATVSTALPYEDKIDNTLDPSDHASAVRNYRAYEREQLRRQAGHGMLKKADISDAWKGEKLKNRETMKVIRLHMELYNDDSDEETIKILKKYGLLKFGDRISRDVVVPADIPLYALHYVIQRVFGWQNSHLRQFEVPKERFNALSNHTASMWSRMVGVVFRSPMMDEGDEFWADDYSGGSFKRWIRKKYTGPYLSQCHGEGILSCKKDMMKLDMEAEYYLLYTGTCNCDLYSDDRKEILSDVVPVYDFEGKRRPEPKPWFGDDIPYRVEVAKLRKIPSEGLKFLFERDPGALLERLPIHCVLAAGKLRLPEDCSEEERSYMDGQIFHSGDEIHTYVSKSLCRIIEKQIDSPEAQVYPMAFTDVLLYRYDFGDNWKVRITASENCPDLVESGRITQAELDRAYLKCRDMYRPVLLARDGEMLIDDVGGIQGFADFLKEINPELEGLDMDEKAEAKQRKKERLTWAEGLGWHKDNSTNFNLL